MVTEERQTLVRRVPEKIREVRRRQRSSKGQVRTGDERGCLTRADCWQGSRRAQLLSVDRSTRDDTNGHAHFSDGSMVSARSYTS